jgi:hypothetical protein
LPQASQPGRAGPGRFFRVDERTGQRWAAQGPPRPVAVCLRLMLALKLSASDAADLLQGLAFCFTETSWVKQM